MVRLGEDNWDWEGRGGRGVEERNECRAKKDKGHEPKDALSKSATLCMGGRSMCASC